MLRPLRHSFILFALFSLSSAAPAIHTTSLIRKSSDFDELVSEINGSEKASGSGFNGPVTVTTVTTSKTNVGTITQTCDITLTPIQVDGKDAVREDKSCKSTVSSNGSTGSTITGSSNGNNNNNSSSGSSSSSAATTTTTSSGSSATSSPSSNGGSGSNNNNNNGGATQSPNFVSPSDVSVIGTGTASASNSAATTASSGSNGGTNNGNNAPPNVSVIGMTTVTGTATGSSAISAPTGQSNQNGAAPPPSVSVLGQTSATGTATTVATAAADQASGSAAAAQASTTGFTIPGKTLQVLPIGLGVFAGISVIALIVVGLVTYERTKYRKTFRQRKLAEAAAPMGYGGMAERS